jgi:hypothetical protein
MHKIYIVHPDFFLATANWFLVLSTISSNKTVCLPYKSFCIGLLAIGNSYKVNTAATSVGQGKISSGNPLRQGLIYYLTCAYIVNT